MHLDNTNNEEISVWKLGSCKKERHAIEYA